MSSATARPAHPPVGARPPATPRLRGPVRAALALVIATAASGACTPLDDAMAAVFGRSMRDQRSFDPYEMTLLPPEGTVPLSAGNYAAGPDEVNLGQPEGARVPPPFTQLEMTQRPEVADSLTNPVPPSPASLARGEQLYERVCIVCHGPDGKGTTGYIYEVHPLLAAYPLDGDAAKARSDGYLYGMIRVGRGVMPAYGHQIGHYDRWHVVNYVRELQGLGAGAEVPGASETAVTPEPGATPETAATTEPGTPPGTAATPEPGARPESGTPPEPGTSPQ